MQKIKVSLVLFVSLFSVCLCHAQTGDSTANEADMAAYLLVYFKDNTHSLHLALSTDGYTFTAVNDGNEVVGGDTIASQKGIRDPHITRGPDGAFYVAMTDLHTFSAFVRTILVFARPRILSPSKIWGISIKGS